MLNLFHGTSARFNIGDRILPPVKTGVISEKGRKKNCDVVFLTKSPKYALIYAGRAVNSIGGSPYVYEVKAEAIQVSHRQGADIWIAPFAIVVKKVEVNGTSTRKMGESLRRRKL